MFTILELIAFSCLSFGLFLLFLNPKSFKSLCWSLFWILFIYFYYNWPIFWGILSFFNLQGIITFNLATETIFLLALLLIITLYLGGLNSQINLVKRGLLVFLQKKEISSKSASIILPAFNEAENLMSLVETIVNYTNANPKKYEIVLVNDGSQDNTGEICDKLEDKYEPVKAIHHKTNLGKTKAFETGVRNSKGDTVILLETDWQYDPEDLELLISSVEKGFDISNGWRVLRSDSFHRILLSKTYNFLLRQFFNTDIRDHNSGFKAFKREVILDLLTKLEKLNLHGPHRFILILAKELGYSVIDVPIRHYLRRAGKSYIKVFRTPLQVISDLLKVRLRLSYRKKDLIKASVEN